MAICGDASRYIIEPDGEDKAVCANHLSKALEKYRSATGDNDIMVRVLRPMERYKDGHGSLTKESSQRRIPCFWNREGEGNSFQRRFANRSKGEKEEEKQDAT